MVMPSRADVQPDTGAELRWGSFYIDMCEFIRGESRWRV
jgi:hypothetical protein